MIKLKPIEERIIRELWKLNRTATTNEIAERANISWNTASTTLERLREQKIVSRVTAYDKKIWQLISIDSELIK